MKRLIVTLAMCLVPMMAAADHHGNTFTASLAGDAGTGFANLMIEGDTIAYTIVTSGMDPAPSSASLISGASIIDLEATFMAGSAAGSVTSTLAPAVAGDPSAWMVEVTNGTDVLSGTLHGADGGDDTGTALYFPVAAALPGLGDTNFVTDARLLNMGADAIDVTIAYYAAGAAGNEMPTASVDVFIAAGEQAVVNDIVGGLLGQTDSKGAIVARADGDLIGSMRIYNDQTDAGLGTFGQYVQGQTMDYAMTSGSVLFLSNEDAATAMGYRSNIGWFNPNPAAVELTLTAYDANGSMLGTKTFSVNAMAQEQFGISSAKLWPELAAYGDFYLMYSVDGDHGIFVYGSVVDNVNGDAIFVAAQ